MIAKEDCPVPLCIRVCQLKLSLYVVQVILKLLHATSCSLLRQTESGAIYQIPIEEFLMGLWYFLIKIFWTKYIVILLPVHFPAEDMQPFLKVGMLFHS